LRKTKGKITISQINSRAACVRSVHNIKLQNVIFIDDNEVNIDAVRTELQAKTVSAADLATSIHDLENRLRTHLKQSKCVLIADQYGRLQRIAGSRLYPEGLHRALLENFDTPEEIWEVSDAIQNIRRGINDHVNHICREIKEKFVSACHESLLAREEKLTEAQQKYVDEFTKEDVGLIIPPGDRESSGDNPYSSSPGLTAFFPVPQHLKLDEKSSTPVRPATARSSDTPASTTVPMPQSAPPSISGSGAAGGSNGGSTHPLPNFHGEPALENSDSISPFGYC